jgi:GT2 family glycosyltransferase
VLHASREWPTVEHEFAPFVAVMFRREALLAVGLLDETLCICWEDYDLCIRLTDGGWSIITTGASEVVHLGSATTGRSSPYITYYSARNRLICLFRYGRLLGILRQGPFIIRSFVWQIKEYGLGNWMCHRALLKGLIHFLLGVRGEGNPPTRRGR